MAERIRLGDFLLSKGAITQAQLEIALKEQKRSGAKLGHVLVSLDFVKEEMLLELLSQQLNIPIYDLSQFEVDPVLTKLLPEAYARRFRALVVGDNEDAVTVVMADPLDITAIDELKTKLKKPVSIALAKEDALLRTIDLMYRRTEEISSYAEKLSEKIDESKQTVVDFGAEQSSVDAPVIKLLQSVFEDALQVGASDIHFEPDEDVLRIRLRIDGLLQEQIVKEKQVASSIALRLKLIGGLNIAERRLPQDGRFNIKIGNKEIDVRLSTMPTQYGESIVMRLLDQSTGLLNLNNIGMDQSMLKEMRTLLHQPHGIILVTGPTGSGKSTTLYGALNELNAVDKKIITVEDPVEYRTERLNQVQVNEKIGLTFSRVLRTTLRQDPDIILVGEMRDAETADIAIRAALTGHLVLSTLHTNDAASSPLRLIDMDIQGFLVSATLRGILAQRLVRKICHACKADYKISEYETKWYQERFDVKDSLEFKIGKGCNQCNQTGYQGRIGVFELLTLTSEMRDAIRCNKTEEFAAETQKKLRGKLLADSAFTKAKEGVTTIEEVMRIAGEG